MSQKGNFEYYKEPPTKIDTPKKTVFIYLGGEGFEGHLFKKSVDLEKSKLTILSEKNS